MKKGFTLVEVLAIIAVLGVMVVLVFPKIGGSIDSKKNKELERITGIVENAAKFYHSFNDDQYKISVETLINEKYVTSDLINPITGERLNGCVRVTKNNDGFLDYKYTSCDNIKVLLTIIGDSQITENYNDSTIVELVEPKKDGFNFKGWELMKGNSILKGNKLIIGTEETVVYAKWEETS